MQKLVAKRGIFRGPLWGCDAPSKLIVEQTVSSMLI